MKSLTIAGLAREGGVGVETIRYYQRRSLLPTPAIPQGSATRGVRRYGDADIKRLRFIRSAQASGFALQEIKELLTLDRHKNRKRAQEIAYARVKDLDAKIAAMTEARRALLDLAKRCEGGKEPCPIIPAFT